jgi:gentisate 1,2-dioxygenase
MTRHLRFLALACALLAVGSAAATEPNTIPHDPRVPDRMRIKRVTAGPDGKSRLDVIELPIAASEAGKSLVSRLYATDVELGYGVPGTFIDWHRVTTPRLFIVLQGVWEFGTGDGKLYRLKAGDIVLAADTTGQGHTSRNVGDVPAFALTVRLPLEDPLKLKPNGSAVK